MNRDAKLKLQVFTSVAKLPSYAELVMDPEEKEILVEAK